MKNLTLITLLSLLLSLIFLSSCSKEEEMFSPIEEEEELEISYTIRGATEVWNNPQPVGSLTVDRTVVFKTNQPAHIKYFITFKVGTHSGNSREEIVSGEINLLPESNDTELHQVHFEPSGWSSVTVDWVEKK